MSEKTAESALFVCFGCLSNVGTLTGIAGLEAVKKVGLEKTNIFCLAALATSTPLVINKTKAVKRIITVDGCPLNCAKKIVESAGFTPNKTINLVRDCSIEKKAPLNYTPEDLEKAVKVIIDALRDRQLKDKLSFKM